MTELYIGLISGTSMDAIDAALVDLRDSNPVLIASHSHTLPGELRTELTELCTGCENEIDRLGQADIQLANVFADAVEQLLKQAKLPPEQITAIGSHGQTIRHRPDIATPFTLQIGNPSTIAERTGITTVADFRARDMAAGGEGAPLVPAFHQAVLQKTETSRAILNVGGIANLTFLPADKATVSGFDCGPGNLLLDAWVNKKTGKAYDDKGEWASSGQVNQALLDIMLADPYFEKAPPKSTGRELFNMAWLEGRAGQVISNLAAEDVQATLCELTARGISDAMSAYYVDCQELIVCGGGVHNAHLLKRIQDLLPTCTITNSAEHGIDPDWMEAMAFAWLAQQTLSGNSGNIPTVTNARHSVILGGIYPGSEFSGLN